MRAGLFMMDLNTSERKARRWIFKNAAHNFGCSQNGWEDWRLNQKASKNFRTEINPFSCFLREFCFCFMNTTYGLHIIVLHSKLLTRSKSWDNFQLAFATPKYSCLEQTPFDCDATKKTRKAVMKDTHFCFLNYNNQPNSVPKNL